MSHTLTTSAGYTYVVTPMAVNVAGGATTDLVAAPGAGAAIWVFALSGGVTVNGTMTLIDDTPTSHTGAIPLLAAGGNKTLLAPVKHPDFAWVRCAEDQKLQVTMSAGSDFDGVLVYATVTF